MYSLRKWMFKPKKSDKTLLAQFYYADEDLNLVAAELDSFDGRKDPERCTALVNQLRHCQDKVIVTLEKMLVEQLPDRRASRDFRVKFPDDVLQEGLAGQLWFGAECLAAGSSIMNREVESASMRPLAKTLTRHLDYLRSQLRDQCLRNLVSYTEKIREALVGFDRLFAEFELSYVSAMVPVKSMREYDMLQEVIVLFCETVNRALRLNLLNQDMIDDYDPALMFTIPRLAIVAGLMVYPEGPLNPDMDPMNMSEMFRPFQTLLYKIRELLWTLSREELWLLEKSLCSEEEPKPLRGVAMEEQLNQLNTADHSSDAANADLDLDLASPTAGEEPRGVMCHSLSTVTVVASGDESQTQVGHTEADGPETSLSQVPSPYVGTPEVTTDPEVAFRPSPQRMAASSLPTRDREVSLLMAHQESSDSGMLRESDRTPAPGVAPQDSHAHTRRLRQSLSWPEIHQAEVPQVGGRRHRYSVSGDPREHTSSMELLHSPQLDILLAQATCTQSAGSHEFTFHLPLDTSTHSSVSAPPSAPLSPGTHPSGTPPPDKHPPNTAPADTHPPDTHPPGTPQHDLSPSTSQADGGGGGEGSEGSGGSSASSAATSPAEDPGEGKAQRIIYTSTGREAGEAAESPARSSPEGSPSPPLVSYITGALNEFFVTDPSFRGVAAPSEAAPAAPEPPHRKVRCSAHRRRRRRRHHHGNQDADASGADSPTDRNNSKSDCDTATRHRHRSHRGVEPLHEQVRISVTGCDDNNTDGAGGPNAGSNTCQVLPRCQHSSDDCDCDKSAAETAERDHEPAAPNQLAPGDNKPEDCVPGGKDRQKPTHKPHSQSNAKLLGVQRNKGNEEGGGARTEHNGREGKKSKPSVQIQRDRGVLNPDSPQIHRVRYAESASPGSQAQRTSGVAGLERDWDRESYASSDTSSYNSECNDDEEIALAIQAAERAARQEARARFKSSGDLIHRLFVCVSGVADQLQTNYASDLRHILKAVFECYSTDVQEEDADPAPPNQPETAPPGVERDSISSGTESSADGASEGAVEDDWQGHRQGEPQGHEDENDVVPSPTRTRYQRQRSSNKDPPEWVPDDDCPHCSSCKVPFTFVRRRHHCRNCGKIFCSRCSSNSVPLPHYGHNKPVRICNHCFMFQVTPFTVDR